MTERDDEGRPQSWVIETEPEFDRIERDGWADYDDYLDALCPNCGQLRSVCGDPEAPWYPQRTHCYATAARQSVMRRMGDYYRKVEPSESNGWMHPGDGVAYWVSTSDLSPDDDFDGAYPTGGASPAADS